MKKVKLKVIPQTEQFGYELQDLETNGEKELLQKLLRPSSVLFDVGAKNGAWTLAALQIEPNIYAYAFESDDSLYPKLKKTLSSYAGARALSLSSLTLDQFCASEGVQGIDFLKIGSKPMTVLEGAKNLLTEKKIPNIQFAYGKDFPHLKDLALLLTKHNYVLFRIFSHGLIPMSEWKAWLENGQYCNYYAILRSQISQCEPMIFQE